MCFVRMYARMLYTCFMCACCMYICIHVYVVYMYVICTYVVGMYIVYIYIIYILCRCVCTHIRSFSELRPSVGLLWRHQRVHERLWSIDVIIRGLEGPTYFRKHTLSEWHFVHHKSHAEDWQCTVGFFGNMLTNYHPTFGSTFFVDRGQLRCNGAVAFDRAPWKPFNWRQAAVKCIECQLYNSTDAFKANYDVVPTEYCHNILRIRQHHTSWHLSCKFRFFPSIVVALAIWCFLSFAVYCSTNFPFCSYGNNILTFLFYK
jgi:hypothetical protein